MRRARGFYRLRARLQSAIFLVWVGIYGILYVHNDLVGIRTSGEGASELEQQQQRVLLERSVGLSRAAEGGGSTLKSCDEIVKAEPAWFTVFYALGVLYMFMAVAIVCDEFFVPALEEMSSSRRLNLPLDVAGATLMAAGGSAPELFSNLFGTFTESEIGFGTILGSAAFNVMFVIAMCALFAHEVLDLSWWPLVRDSVCYAMALIVLAIFTGVTSPNVIELWEASVLFGLYIGYILLMWKNRDVYTLLTGKTYDYDAVNSTEQTENEPAQEHFHDEENSSTTNSSIQMVDMNQLPSNLASIMKPNSVYASSSWVGTFRAGVLRLLRHPRSWVETGGVGIVAKIAGDADHIFRQVDVNGDGYIDHDELLKLFEALECPVSPQELEEVFQVLDEDHDGVISAGEFEHWYTSSADLIRSQVRHVFDAMDTNKSGTLDKQELKGMLHELDPRVTDQDVDEAIEAMYRHGSREEITFEEFEEWYEHSMIYEREKKLIEEELQESIWDSIKPPIGEGCLSWVQYLLAFPFVALLLITIPDVRRPGLAKYCYLSFLVSVAWVGTLSYFLVSWAEIIGNTMGIPSIVMGLTVVAAGTSVPDLLGSVIVTRRGAGDMAISSSIGSNIFDILVGLAVPWLMYDLWPSKPRQVSIGAEHVFLSLMVLLTMLVLTVISVHCQGWKLTRWLGVMLIILYIGFLTISVTVELPFKTCRPIPPRLFSIKPSA